MSSKDTMAQDLKGVAVVDNHHPSSDDSGSPDGSGGEVLAQAIGDLSVREKCTNESPRNESAPMSSLPPISTMSGVAFNTRTASPVTESISPTFGGAGQTNSSPSTSQVSIGSVGPTLVASLLNQRHHYDLTPVMRNTTSNDIRQADNRASYPRSDTESSRGNHGTHSVVSPETVDEENNDFLHGEHLSLPADLSATGGDQGPILPNLRKSTIPTLPMQRAQSMGRVGHVTHGASKGTELPHLSEKPPPAPVEFPSSRKFYSFTSREQYKGLQDHDDDDLSEEESLDERPDLTPYQPSRQEFAEIEESAPPEELESIFIARRRRSSIRQNVVIEGVLREEDEESSQKNHRLLQNPIPMTDRQWSIPSLHMAHRLATDGSLASLTDHPDEDESLLYIRPCADGDMTDEDEASLSSRASSLYMSIGGTAGVPSSIPLSILEARSEEIQAETEPRPMWNDDNSSSLSQLPSIGSSSLEGVQSFGSTPAESSKVIVDSPWNLLSGTQSSLSDENSALAVDGDRALRRKRKQRQREEAALSWLQSLQEQSQQPAVAEAASSKFLTGRTAQAAFRKSNEDASAFAAIKEEGQRPS